MGNNQNKPSLRKAQSVPDTQALSPDVSVLVKEKSQSHQRLNQINGKQEKPDKKPKQLQQQNQDLPELPPAEAAFLPEFPLRGDLEELEFEIIDVIAKGAYGNVIKVQREDQKRFYAIKVLDKRQIIHEGAIRQCKDEAAIQSVTGNHPLIVKAHEYWQSRHNLYIALDYIPHGDMFTLWTFHGAFPEPLVRLYIAEMALVIDYLHNSSVIYRDVKMENILFNAKGHIQLTDFGLAKWLQGGEQTRTVCGTLQYMAPEVLSVYPYTHSADWWSVGILMYAMLVGRYPVDGADTHTRMAQKVFDCDYLLPSDISDSAQDVINRVLTKSPHKRLCDINILQDLPFFDEIFFPDLIDQKIDPIDVVPEDFFPMTGESWAPHLTTSDEQAHFAEFDDSNETITTESRFSHLPHYRHQQQLEPAPQQALPQQSTEQQPQQYTPQYSQPLQQPRRQSNSQPPHFLAGYSSPSSSQYTGQFSVTADPVASINNHRLAVQALSNYNTTLETTSSVMMSQAAAPQAIYSGASAMLSQNSPDSRGDMGRNGGLDGYGTNRSNKSLDRQSSSSGGATAAASGYNQNVSAVAPVGSFYPSSSTNNIIKSMNSSESNNRISLGFKTGDTAPTLSLKSPTGGFTPTPIASNQQYPGYRSVNPASPGYTTTPTQPAYNSQAYGMSSSSTTSSGQRSQVQGWTPGNSLPHSSLNTLGNSQQFDQGFRTVEGPPTITLPSLKSNFNQSPNTPYNRNIQEPQLTSSGSVYVAPDNSLKLGYTDTKRLEEATIRLDSTPQLQLPQMRGTQMQTVRERPVVPVKPIPPQKPPIVTKPLAPVRPTPAPRKSLQGQNSNNPNFNQEPKRSAPFHPGAVNPMFNQGTLGNANLNQRQQDLGSAFNTSVTNSSSYKPLDQHIASYQHSASASVSENSRSRSGSNSNIFPYTDAETPSTKSPSLENASFKWNLPADATPSFV